MTNEDAQSGLSNTDFLVLTTLTVLALMTRGYGLGEWHLMGDEYYTFYYSAERYKSFINPAYYALVLGSFTLFGVSEWSARLPAMLLGVLCIPVFWITWRSVIGRNAALIGALFIVFSSWHLWHSQFSRFYTGVFLFGSLSYFLYYQAIRDDSLKYLVAALAAMVAGILFHATAVMVPASCGLFSLIALTIKGSEGIDYSKRVMTVHLSLCAVIGLLALPFLWQISENWYETGQKWGYGPAKLALQIVKYVQIPIAGSAFLGLILLLRKDLIKGIFFASGIGLPVLALLIVSPFVSVRPDYMLYTMPLVFVLSAYLCEEISDKRSSNWLASYSLVIIVVVSLLPEMASHYTGKKSLDIREVVAVVEEAHRPGDRIFSLVPGANFKHYATRSYPIEPKYEGYPYDNDIPWEEVLQPYKDDRHRLWIILPIRRQSLAKNLENWLICNAALVWRKSEKRYDYTVKGYQVWRTNGRSCTETQ